MHYHDVYTTGFDESTGSSIQADTCPHCGGPLRVDGGEIDCRDCRRVLNGRDRDLAPTRPADEVASDPTVGSSGTGRSPLASEQAAGTVGGDDG